MDFLMSCSSRPAVDLRQAKRQVAAVAISVTTRGWSLIAEENEHFSAQLEETLPTDFLMRAVGGRTDAE